MTLVKFEMSQRAALLTVVCFTFVCLAAAAPDHKLHPPASLDPILYTPFPIPMLTPGLTYNNPPPPLPMYPLCRLAHHV